ncbi:MAG TPA: hypothetical protein VER12_06985 [Polyangiaceae bacterium]|nr:hypothetical protein [Polyangiaceae bacterium]
MGKGGMNGNAARWGCLVLLALGCGQSARSFGTPDEGDAGSGGEGATSAKAGAATVGGGSGDSGAFGDGGTGDASGADAGSAGEGGTSTGSDDGGTPGVAGTGGMSVDLCAGVLCNAQDQCHDAGKCTPATGKCSYPNKADDSPCSVDNNACTPDTCKSGVCTVGAAKSCPAPGLCKLQGVCSTTTGACSTPAADDHTSCGTSLECLGGTCLCTRTSCPNGCCTAGGACAACTPTTVVTRTEAAQDLTVGSGQVYFLEGALVYSLPTSGSGMPTMLSYPPPPATLTSIHVDGSYVYGGKIGNNTPATIARMSSIGGPFVDVAGSKTWEGTRLASNTASVFAGSTLSSNYITVSPKDGSSPAITLVSSPAVDYAHFAVDDAYLYFISGGSTAISRVPVAGGGATAVTSADSGETFNDLAVSGSKLVIATSKRIATVAAAGGSAVTLDTGAAYSVRADGTNAYYFRSKGMACAGGSELYAMPLAGGNLRRLVSEPSVSCVRSVVQDASAVYWLADKSIKKIAK